MQSQVNDVLLGQSVKFPRANPKIAVSNKTFHSVRKSVWKVPQIVNRTAINKCFVTNMILFITEFAHCSNRRSTNYLLHRSFK